MNDDPKYPGVCTDSDNVRAILDEGGIRCDCISCSVREKEYLEYEIKSQA